MKFNRRTALGGLIGGAAATIGGIPLLDRLLAGQALAATTTPPTWMLEGVTVENCTCKAFCVLNLGPFKVDGWHRSACIWSIRNGHSGRVDLSGTSIALAYEAPDDSMSAKGATRAYIGETANAVQRRELEAILAGDRGGVFSMFRDSSANKLPVQTAAISLVSGDSPSATVGNVGRVTLRRLKTKTGKQTVLRDAVYPEAFGVAVEDLCDASGSVWSDPGMTAWRSGGAGGIAEYKLIG